MRLFTKVFQLVESLWIQDKTVEVSVHKYVACTANFKAYLARLYSLASDTEAHSSNPGIVSVLIGAIQEAERNN
jgi:hypothetical protein